MFSLSVSYSWCWSCVRKKNLKKTNLLLDFAWTASAKLIQLASLLMVVPRCFADVTVAIVGPWRLYSKSEWPMAFHPQQVYQAACQQKRERTSLWVRSRFYWWAAWLWVRCRFFWRVAWYILRDGRQCAILRVGWGLAVTGSGPGGRGPSGILQHRLPTVLPVKAGFLGHGPSTEP